VTRIVDATTKMAPRAPSSVPGALGLPPKAFIPNSSTERIFARYSLLSGKSWLCRWRRLRHSIETLSQMERS